MYRLEKNKEVIATSYFGKTKKDEAGNPEKVKESQAKYYADYSEKIKKRQAIYRAAEKKEKVECVCGSNVRKSNIREHEKTKKHFNYIQSLEE